MTSRGGSYLYTYTQVGDLVVCFAPCGNLVLLAYTDPTEEIGRATQTNTANMCAPQ